MRALLVHNKRSGGAKDEGTLVRALEGIGWTVEDCIEREALEGRLKNAPDAVAVAGGDGTVAKVARTLAGTEVPLAVVPTGTANNIARSLGLGVDAHEAVKRLARAELRHLDLGRVASDAHGEGCQRFVEGFGVGVFAYVLGERASRRHKVLRRALRLVAKELEDYDPPAYEVEADGRDLSGRYLLVVAMNTKSFGPALPFAPEARWDDGVLDLVLVTPDARDALVHHLRRSSIEGDIAFPPFQTVRVRHVRLEADGRWAHLDDRPRELEGPATIDVEPAAVSVLVPAR
jgi:diacylglycerol kinase (ATP)